MLCVSKCTRNLLKTANLSSIRSLVYEMSIDYKTA